MLPLAALVFTAAVLIGALLTHVVSSMPLAIHACAEHHGRHVLLGSAAEGARPSAGHRASPRRAAYATLNTARALVGTA